MEMVKGFRDFIMRGNVVDLAVAVVLGVAFAQVVTALVTDILTPLIAAIFGKPDFSQLSFTINHSRFLYGAFIDALLAFLFIAAAIYFFVVVPLNALSARRRGQAEATTRPCPFCTNEVAVAASRCPFCTSDLRAAPQPS
jgi:large conductance mechanosensitive channel